MTLTEKQLKKFTKKFEIKARSVILIDKGKVITIVINEVRIFNVKRELVEEFLKVSSKKKYIAI